MNRSLIFFVFLFIISGAYAQSQWDFSQFTMWQQLQQLENLQMRMEQIQTNVYAIDDAKQSSLLLSPEELRAQKIEEVAKNRSDMFSFLQKANFSLKASDLEQMSEADIRHLYYRYYRFTGKDISEAMRLSETVTIPMHRYP